MDFYNFFVFNDTFARECATWSRDGRQ